MTFKASFEHKETYTYELDREAELEWGAFYGGTEAGLFTDINVLTTWEASASVDRDLSVHQRLEDIDIQRLDHKDALEIC